MRRVSGEDASKAEGCMDAAAAAAPAVAWRNPRRDRKRLNSVLNFDPLRSRPAVSAPIELRSVPDRAVSARNRHAKNQPQDG